MLPNFGHCLVEYNEMRFLIMDRPSKANITQFVEVCFNIYKEAGVQGSSDNISTIEIFGNFQ